MRTLLPLHAALVLPLLPLLALGCALGPVDETEAPTVDASPMAQTTAASTPTPVASGATEASVLPSDAPDGRGATVTSGASDEPPPADDRLEPRTAKPGCWRDGYGRGIGQIPTECGADEKSGLLCYPKCAPGYVGVGPVCWESCPEGFHDDGLTCRKDVQFAWADTSQCSWLDKCGALSACTRCPPGFANDGCVCHVNPEVFFKKSYGRGVGSTMSCDATKDSDAGLCYDKCSSGYGGTGPVCWHACPKDWPVSCGLACTKTQDDCTWGIINGTAAIVESVLAHGRGEIRLPADDAGGLKRLELPSCY
ncbi:MAG: hypothetical protein U0183_22935 [Polyangiaceae bacterium]